MSWNCTHPECQIYDSCQHQPFKGVQDDPDTTDTPRFRVVDWADATWPGGLDKVEESPGSQPQQEDSDVIEKIPESADQDAALDTLVSRASIPNLGALIKQGVKQGLIAPTTSYR